ncbi:MAG: hypothetical protein ABJE95_35280 [Byssovorax sp.]
MRLFVGLVGAAIFAVGCGTGAGEVSTSSGDPDGGPDVIEVVLDGGGAPATPPDGASKCPQGGICNYQTGKGCPAGNPTCLPASDGNGGVIPACNVAGAVASGGACTASTDCVAGHLCAEGACHKLCCGGDWTGCGSVNDHCIESLVYGDGKGGTIQTNAMLCFPINTCNALLPSSCPKPGTTCQIADPTGATACLNEAAGGAGQACPCKGGFTCIDGGNGGTCRRLCKAVEGGGDPFCQSGEGTCVHFNRDPGGVGECTP